MFNAEHTTTDDDHYFCGFIITIFSFNEEPNYNAENNNVTGFSIGFICPVHTPDGAPCGLLNHLAKNCVVLNEVPEDPKALPKALTMLGMTPVRSTPPVPHAQCLEVMLDGSLVGFIRKSEAQKFANKLRVMKTREEVRKNVLILFRVTI